MTFIKATLLCFLLICLSHASGIPRHRIKGNAQLRNLKPIKLEDVIPNKFGQYGFNGTWISNNAFLYYDKERNLYKADVGSNKKEMVLAFDVLVGSFDSFYGRNLFKFVFENFSFEL